MIKIYKEMSGDFIQLKGGMEEQRMMDEFIHDALGNNHIKL